MLHFYSFLTDRERAGAVAVMYESRPPQQPSTVTTGETNTLRLYLEGVELVRLIPFFFTTNPKWRPLLFQMHNAVEVTILY